LEYFSTIDGDKAVTDLMDGVVTTARVEGGGKIGC
jgi:hypothetical protein